MAHSNEIARVVARGTRKSLSRWSGQGSKSVSQNFGTRKIVNARVSVVRKSVSQNFGARQPRESKRALVRGWELIIRTRLALPHEIINTSFDNQDKDRTST